MQAACFDLFDRAACLLTDDQDVGQPWTDALEGFWRDVGCRVHWLSAADHDRLVARMSHLPHMMAALTARVGYRDPADGAFAGGGMRDTTRVAAGDPAMWAEILLENREAVIDALGPVREWLTDLHGMLERGDERAMRDWLAEAQRLHAAGSRVNEFPDK